VLKGKSQQTLHLLVIEGDLCKRTIALEAATYSIACGLSNSTAIAFSIGFRSTPNKMAGNNG
jgi:hypothetical protein